jgi:hypothetical protein
VYRISHSWVSVLSVYVLLFGVVYLTWCDVAIGSIKEQHQILFRSLKKVRRRPWHWLDKRSEKKARAIHGKSKLTETEKSETGEVQSQEHTHNFLWHHGDSSQKKIRSGRPNSQIRILLWRSTATTWKCAKTLPRISATKKLTVASWQITVSHFLFN